MYVSGQDGLRAKVMGNKSPPFRAQLLLAKPRALPMFVLILLRVACAEAYKKFFGLAAVMDRRGSEKCRCRTERATIQEGQRSPQSHQTLNS